MTDNRKFIVTGVENIDDRYHGLNFMKGPYSVGYIETVTYKDAIAIMAVVAKMFKAANILQDTYNIPVTISINQEHI